MSNPTAEPRNAKKGPAPTAMGDPDTLALVLPKLLRGVELVKAELREQNEDDTNRTIMMMVDRFLKQTKAHVGPPAPID